MTEMLLAEAAPELGATLLIVDWSATLLSLAFLLGGLGSLWVAKHPSDVVERFGPGGFALGSILTSLYAGICLLHGGLSLFSGRLLTPNGEAFTGGAAYAGALGFLVLAAYLGLCMSRNLRSLAVVQSPLGERRTA